jgi:hypothetical protein
MRNLIVLLAVLVASPAYAQRVFRASVKIDDVQNERLDEIEAKVNNLNETVKVLAQTVNTLAEVQRQRIEVSKLELQAETQPKPKDVSTKVVSHTTAPPQEMLVPIQQTENPNVTKLPQTQNALARLAWRTYPDGQYRVRYADVQPRSQVWNHLRSHGYSDSQIEGLSMFEALAIHDLTHGGVVSPTMTLHRDPPTQQVAHQQPQQAYAIPKGVLYSDAGCANGQCARQGVSYSRSRPRLFGLFR